MAAAMRCFVAAVERLRVQLSGEQQLRMAGEAEQAKVVEETQQQASADDHLAELDRQTKKIAERVGRDELTPELGKRAEEDTLRAQKSEGEPAA